MRNRSLIAVIIVGFGAIGVSAALGFWAVAVYGRCAKPYAECAANGHLGELWGGLLLFILAAVAGLSGLVMVITGIPALVKRSGRAGDER